MKIKAIKQNMLHYLGNVFLHGIISVLCKTVKIKKVNYDIVKKMIETKQNFVLAFWHGTMLIPWYIHRNTNLSALVSQSKDGSLLANSLIKWKYKVERGSSHKGGKEALNTLIESAKNNYSLAITPDGPTGPAKVMKAGAVIAAQRSSIPLILLGVSYSKKYVFKSWDKFEVPKFFSRATLVYSNPLLIDEKLEREETTKLISEYDLLLNKLQNDAEKIS